MKTEETGMDITKYSLKSIYDTFKLQDLLTAMIKTNYALDMLFIKNNVDRFVQKNFFGNCKILQGVNCNKNLKRFFLICVAGYKKFFRLLQQNCNNFIFFKFCKK